MTCAPVGIRRAWWLLFLMAAVLACGKPKLIAAPCQRDDQCPSGTLCENYQCVDAKTKACDVVTNGNPILQPDPYSVDFSDLDSPDASIPLTLDNIGNCTLTLFEADLLGADAGSPFSCELCDQKFPIEIFPGRSKTFNVGFSALKVGPAKDTISILSDDKEFPTLQVPLAVNFLGIPKPSVTPNPIDFGYVPMGLEGKVTVQVSNQGTGVAPMTVTAIDIAPDTTDFQFGGGFTFTGPMVLKPVANGGDVLTFEADYTPRTTAKHNTELLVTTDKGVLHVPMAGNAETPPQMSVAPMMLDLGQVPLGSTNTLPLTITNMGGADLKVTYHWAGPMMMMQNTDLWATPNVLPPITAGSYTQLQVSYTASSIGLVQGLLVIDSNDPMHPSITIPVSGTGIAATGSQVVKVEMVFDNGADGVFDADVRMVAMTLEHPFGLVCNKQNPNPMGWAPYGQCNWISFPPKDEPQRAILSQVQQDGTFRVMLNYLEDCSSIPTGLLAGLLGISVDVLVGYLSGGTAQLDPAMVSQMISQVCLSHSSSNATVRVYLNGVLTKETTVNLGQKGDSKYAVDLVRTNGVFTVQ